jgi:translation initiation factor IF-2
MATLILEQGKLKNGDIVATPSAFGKVKIMEDFQGRQIAEAFPSQPVLVLGFEDVPKVGEEFRVFNSAEEAKANVKAKEKGGPEVINVEDGQKVLNLILKADVLGSLEAIEEVLKNLPQEKVILRILKGEVGEINETDVKLARQAKAKILGFRVKVNPVAESLAEREKIRIMKFDVIYDLVEGVRKYMEKLFEPEIVRTDLGKIKTLVLFLTEKNRQIVGGKVVEGLVKKGTLIEVVRAGEVKGKGRMINLQRNKKDIEQAPKGEEVGILYEGNEKIEKDDLLVIYTEERRKI